jgi:hypothetical protein|tara:strand:+ start:149 stop:529 length:381 start_codon:yes stop_codon:yes gene_type:complete
MELDFIKNINEFNDNVVRLYNFDKEEAIKFRDLIEETIINNREKLDLSLVDFIEPRNCNLILALYKTDEGIITNDEKSFYCALTLGSFIDLVDILEPFCIKNTIGHEYLYDIDNPTDFLFSPAGTW